MLLISKQNIQTIQPVFQMPCTDFWSIRTDNCEMEIAYPLKEDNPGLDVATCGVANTSFYSVVTRFSRLVANLALKIGDFLLCENVH